MTTQRKTSAILTAKAGQAAALEALLRGLAVPSRAEPGNLKWDLWQDQTNPEVFVIDELYVDAAAVEAHRASAHFLAYLARVNDLAVRVSVTSLPLDLA